MAYTMTKVAAELDEAAWLEKITRITNRRLTDEQIIGKAALEALSAKADAEEELQNKKLAKETDIQKRIAEQGLIATQEMYDLQVANAKAVADLEHENNLKKLEALQEINQEEYERQKAQLEDLHQQNLKDIEEEAKSKLTQGKVAYEKLKKEQAKQDEKEAKEKEKEEKENARKKGQEVVSNTKNILAKGQRLDQRWENLKNTFDAGTDNKGDNIKQGLTAMTKALSDFTATLTTDIDKIARKQSAIDTRLQGWGGKTKGGSYWASMNQDINTAAGISPLVKQEDIVANVEQMVSKGIAYNVEQRAFLATIKDKIATTFEAFDGSLSRLVRIQQMDSTAARLGMESAMTAFLNNMYETTEYLTNVASSVRSSIEEASALMTDQAAVEMEYQVQKWLGSLYSVGMSQTAVNSIASTFGQIAAGDVSGITGGNTSNLLLMAANRAGISVSDALSDGLDASNTNKLMQAMVDYLAEIYEETKDSKLLQQQFANVYGVKASDLRAAANLSTSVTNIAGNNLTYSAALGQLTSMANSMGKRTSMGEKLENASANFRYTLASGIANNPVLYGIFKTSGILDDLVGGINIPAISVVGNGVDLNATVADLMRVAALSGSVISGVANMIQSGSNGGLTAASMLKTMGIGGSTSAVSRGKGAGLATSGVTLSSSGYVGNSSSSDVQNKTLSDANDDANKQMVEAQESEESDTPNKVIDEHIVSILQILQDATTGSTTFNVRVADYGLVWNK